MLQRLFCLLVALSILGVSPVGTASQAQDGSLPFSCAAFSATTSAADLRERFGAANVKTALVPWGGAEGDFHQGTVLFDGTSNAKLQILWRDATNERDPEWVSVRGTHTRWRSPAGVTLGTSLRMIEQLNGRPFRLIGFGSDVSGTVMAWSGGRLEAQNSGNCRVRARLAPDWDRLDSKASALIKQLKGEVELSSGHPGMQGVNPKVNELFLQYQRTAG